MSTVRINFNALDYVDKAKEYGIPDQFAKYQAKQIEDQIQQIEQAFDQSDHVIEEKLNSRKLATKKDILKLEKEIAVSKNQVIIWVSGIMSALLIASGLIQHFIK